MNISNSRRPNLRDLYIISFPKCGRTWLRLLIGKALQLQYSLHEDVNLLELDSMFRYNKEIPRIKINHDDEPHFKKPEELSTSKEAYKNKKVLFLVRDPRDVIVSLYFQKTKRDNLYQGELSDFIYEQQGGLQTILKYYNIWADHRSLIKDFKILKYEELHDTPVKKVREVLEFMGLKNIRRGIVRKAVEFAQFNNMRKMEKENRFNSFRLVPTNQEDLESYKTRKGEIGGYKQYLNDEQINYLNGIINKELSSFYSFYRS